MALLSLLIATLSDEAMEHVIGCRTSHEAWTCLQERFASILVVWINQLKTELHTTQKEGESVDKFLMGLKNIRDQLASARERISDNDLMIVVLSGLPAEFEMIRTVILARDTTLSLKDFRTQLLVAEESIQSLSSSMAAICVQGEGSNSQGY